MTTLPIFQTYKDARTGSLGVRYVSDDGVSIDLSHRLTPTSSKRARVLHNEAKNTMLDAPSFTGDLAAHTETGFCAVTELANGWTLVGTDVGDIGGMPVSLDGAYVLFAGRIAPCNVPLDF